MLDRELLHQYWREPSWENHPLRYAKGIRQDKRSEYLSDLVDRYLPEERQDSILEVGSNVGRNLNSLYQRGYRNLHGVEINQGAVKMMPLLFEDLVANVLSGSIEQHVGELPEVDLLYTMAVFMHIHPDSEWIFEQLAQKTKKYIITIEDEYTNKERHCARNHQEIFGAFGFTQLWHEWRPPGLNGHYVTRVLQREWPQ